MTEVGQERMNQENVLEEQRRNAEETAAAAAEAEAIRLQRMDLITQIADLEKERDRFTNRLRRFELSNPHKIQF